LVQINTRPCFNIPIATTCLHPYQHQTHEGDLSNVEEGVQEMIP